MDGHQSNSSELHKIYQVYFNLTQELQVLAAHGHQGTERYRVLYECLNSSLPANQRVETVKVQTTRDEVSGGANLAGQISNSQLAQIQAQVAALKHVNLGLANPEPLLKAATHLSRGQVILESSQLLEMNLRRGQEDAFGDAASIPTTLRSLANKRETFLQKPEQLASAEVENNKIMNFQVEQRIKELELMEISGLYSGDLLRRVRTEKLFLKSLPIYQKVKSGVFSNLFNYLDKQQFPPMLDRTYYDRSFFKKEKTRKPDSSGHHATSGVELVIKQEQTYRKVQKHAERP